MNPSQDSATIAQKPSSNTSLQGVAVVAIGRNEGERLRQCLQSVVARVGLVVYVDSGSTDGSVEMARRLGCEVVELDMTRPFTAARARNAGFERVHTVMPSVKHVQFVDGDCEVVDGWLQEADRFLASHPDVAAVCGRRRERYPARSIYNRLCDMEWRVPAGPIKAFGGDVMIRADVLARVGGYREDLIAGEEPELCVRLRARGWRLQALGVDMSLHDAAMLRFGQWWRRVMRSGYAFAEGAYLHGAAPERHWVWESVRAWVWGLGLPLLMLLGAVVWSPWALAALIVYPLQMLRLYLFRPGPARERLLRAVFDTVGRFPELLGQLRFVRKMLLGQRIRLIEYK